jgi:hypothetical protein
VQSINLMGPIWAPFAEGKSMIDSASLLLPLRVIVAPWWVFGIAIAVGLAIRVYQKSRDKGR